MRMYPIPTVTTGIIRYVIPMSIIWFVKFICIGLGGKKIKRLIIMHIKNQLTPIQIPSFKKFALTDLK